jgi:hypothetical protein
MVTKIVLCCLFAVFLQVNSTPVIVENNGMYGDLFQGDIMLTPRQQEIIDLMEQGIQPSTGLLNSESYWPMNLRGFVILPYIFERNVFCESAHLSRLNFFNSVYHQLKVKSTTCCMSLV